MIKRECINKIRGKIINKKLQLDGGLLTSEASSWKESELSKGG